MRSLALGLALLCVTTAVRAEPTDGGAPPADAAPATPTPPPVAPAAPLASVALAPTPTDAAPRARPLAIHRSALFWTSIAVAAFAVVAIGVGAGLAAAYHPRYALVTF